MRLSDTVDRPGRPDRVSIIEEYYIFIACDRGKRRFDGCVGYGSLSASGSLCWVPDYLGILTPCPAGARRLRRWVVLCVYIHSPVTFAYWDVLHC